MVVSRRFDRELVWRVVVGAAFFLLGAKAQPAELRITRTLLGAQRELTIEVPGRSGHYYILQRGDSVTRIEQSVDIRFGTDAQLGLIDRAGTDGPAF